MVRQVVDKIANQILTDYSFHLTDIAVRLGHYLKAGYPQLEYHTASLVDTLCQPRIIIWLDKTLDIEVPFKYMQVWVEVREIEYYRYEVPSPY